MRVFDTEVYEVEEEDLKSIKGFSKIVAITSTVIFFLMSLSLLFFLAKHIEFVADKGIQAFSIIGICFATKAFSSFSYNRLNDYLTKKLESLADLGT